MDNPAINNPAQMPDFGLTEFPAISFQPLCAMPNRTSNSSNTKPSEAVTGLPEEFRLKRIARSEELWDKLTGYATTVWSGVPTRTCMLPEALKPSTVHPFPPVEEQVMSAELFHAWYYLYSLLLRKRRGATCELSIQDELTFILNFGVTPALHMRYINTNNGDVLPPDVYLPAFVRPVSAMLACAMDGQDKGGYPDNLLIWDAEKGSNSNRLCAEVKATWSCSDVIIESLVSGDVAEPETGEVSWWDSGDCHNLLLQIWGECHFLDVDYGFVTNGSVIRMFVRTEENELCFSTTRSWSDPDVFLAMLGLCFVAIDHPHGKNRSIKNYLCDPATDRKRDWPTTKVEDEGSPGPEEEGSPGPKSATPSEYTPTDEESDGEQPTGYNAQLATGPSDLEFPPSNQVLGTVVKVEDNEIQLGAPDEETVTTDTPTTGTTKAATTITRKTAMITKATAKPGSRPMTRKHVKEIENATARTIIEIRPDVAKNPDAAADTSENVSQRTKVVLRFNPGGPLRNAGSKVIAEPAPRKTGIGAGMEEPSSEAPADSGTSETGYATRSKVTKQKAPGSGPSNRAA